MKYIITAGGTGGHIYPGVMIARELISQGHDVIFIASHRKIDRDILEKENFKTKYYKMNGFSRKFSPGGIYYNIKSLIFLMIVSIKMIFLCAKFRPNVTVGMGGYITFPVVIISKLFGAKTVVHEQNSYPGLVNRKLAPQVDLVFYTYSACLNYFSDTVNKNKYIYSSNPRIEEAKKYSSNVKEDYILFMGGSLGAEKINDIAIEYANDTNTKVILVVGNRYYHKYHALESENIKVYAYLDDPLEFISKAKVVVTRAGATTLLECAALNAKIIAIPSPNVVADHQTLNAKELEKFAIIKVLKESDINEVMIKEVIAELVATKEYKSQLNEINSLSIIVNRMKEL